MSDNKNLKSEDAVKTVQKKETKKTSKPKEQSGLKRWFKELKSEMKKVVWPTKTQVLNNTGVVLVTVLMAVVLISSFDFVFSYISDTLINFG